MSRRRRVGGQRPAGLRDGGRLCPAGLREGRAPMLCEVETAMPRREALFTQSDEPTSAQNMASISVSGWPLKSFKLMMLPLIVFVTPSPGAAGHARAVGDRTCCGGGVADRSILPGGWSGGAGRTQNKGTRELRHASDHARAPQRERARADARGERVCDVVGANAEGVRRREQQPQHEDVPVLVWRDRALRLLRRGRARQQQHRRRGREGARPHHAGGRASQPLRSASAWAVLASSSTVVPARSAPPARALRRRPRRSWAPQKLVAPHRRPRAPTGAAAARAY